jgi:hypothetical protein
VSNSLTHAATASFIALTCAHVTPHETSYITAALISATILDLDHLPSVIKDWEIHRQNGFRAMHYARSVFHKLFGLLAAGILSALLFLADPKLASVVFIAFTIHLAQDWLMGKSQPFRPVDNTLVQLFTLSAEQKWVIDLILLAIFGGLWIAYLSGGL